MHGSGWFEIECIMHQHQRKPDIMEWRQTQPVEWKDYSNFQNNFVSIKHVVGPKKLKFSDVEGPLQVIPDVDF